MQNVSHTKQPEKTIAIAHDIERGLGHLNSDPIFAKRVDKTSDHALDRMLEIENKLDIPATYNVMGSFYHQVKQKIMKGNHALGFHSYDHDTSQVDDNSHHGSISQLQACRLLDRQVKGYRPPQSLIPPDLNDRNLNDYNFEWFASDVASLNTHEPKLENGIVKIPIHLDDFDLYKNNIDFNQWKKTVDDLIDTYDFIAISLHDCYAEFWLDHYENFLQSIKALGCFKTFDEIAAEVIMANTLS